MAPTLRNANSSLHGWVTNPATCPFYDTGTVSLRQGSFGKIPRHDLDQFSRADGGLLILDPNSRIARQVIALTPKSSSTLNHAPYPAGTRPDWQRKARPQFLTYPTFRHLYSTLTVEYQTGIHSYHASMKAAWHDLALWDDVRMKEFGVLRGS